VQMATRGKRGDVPVTREIVPGVRLHLLRTDRFTTSHCRVVLHRDLGTEAGATAILASVLESATAEHPTREALAHRLADLYGAALHLGVGKLGDRQILVGSLDWPTAFVPDAEPQLAAGLELLREVWSRPKRGPDGSALDAELVETERVNHLRSLRGLRDDKGRYALTRCLESVCADEPYGLDVNGTEAQAAAVTPASLAALHARLLATAPMEIFLVGNLSLRAAAGAIRRHLLWPGRASRVRRLPPVASVRAARARPRRIVETDHITQGKIVLCLRGALRPGTAHAAAAETLAGVLGGGSYGRLFKVVREEHGLCYYASAGWQRAKGLLLIQTGVEPAQAARAQREILELTRAVSGGALDPESLAHYRLDIEHRVAALRDSPRAMLGWYQERLALGLDPSPDVWLAGQRAVTSAAVRRAGARLSLDTAFHLMPENA
jgi:predicted Zn-dependent peptidase